MKSKKEDGGLSSRKRTLSKQRRLAGLVLRDLVKRVLLALLAGAEGLASLGNIHHLKQAQTPRLWSRLGSERANSSASHH